MEATVAKDKGGRQRGSTTRLAKEAILTARETGLLPHEILLDMARGNPQKVRTVVEKDGEPIITEEWVTVSVEEQRDAAKAAAPYYAPRISTVEVISGVSDDNLDAIIEQLAAEAGVSLGTGGEGPTQQATQPTQPSTGSKRRRVDI